MSVSGPKWRYSSVISAGRNASLRLRFSLRIEIVAAFTAAHRQRGEGIFKGLPKAEELMMERFTEGAHSVIVPRRARFTCTSFLPETRPIITRKLNYALWFNQTFQHVAVTGFCSRNATGVATSRRFGANWFDAGRALVYNINDCRNMSIHRYKTFLYINVVVFAFYRIY